ncbi:hypothetical protein ZHAS_00020564 [Anopheles sinensis]|uniref:Uncharacterized protein n=1 Tax=Anopheles sinensis TaxID=74873 RepID=A0A084WQ54_ANOSI|nr:hypothetical protein ZHAS_00020564 [Anopheles sinensis]
MALAQGQQQKLEQQQRPPSSNMSKVKVHNKVCRQEWTLLGSSIVTVLLMLSLTVTLAVRGQQLQEGTGAPNGIEWPMHPSSGSSHHPHHHRKHPQRHHHQHRDIVADGNDEGDDGGGGGSDGLPMGKKLENFLLIDFLNDGERERRIHWNGIIGKETSIADTRPESPTEDTFDASTVFDNRPSQIG